MLNRAEIATTVKRMNMATATTISIKVKPGGESIFRSVLLDIFYNYVQYIINQSLS